MRVWDRSKLQEWKQISRQDDFKQTVQNMRVSTMCAPSPPIILPSVCSNIKLHVSLKTENIHITYIHIYIYTYVNIERQTERDREREREQDGISKYNGRDLSSCKMHFLGDAKRMEIRSPPDSKIFTLPFKKGRVHQAASLLAQQPEAVQKWSGM